MTEQSANSQDSHRTGWQSPPQAANAVSIGTTEIRTTTKQVCRECGEHVHSQIEACPACGETLTHAPKQIHCMHCYTPASSELVVCPGCGRELREAPPKVVTLAIPALLALLLVVLVVSQWERVSPIAWARSNLVRGVVLVEDISASIEPEMVIVMTPIVEPVVDGSFDGSMDGSAAGSPDNAQVVVPDESIIVSDTQAVAMGSAQSDGESVVTPLPADNLPANGDGQKDDPTSVLAEAAAQESPIGIGGRATETVVSSVVEQDALPAGEPPASGTPLPTPTVEPPTLTPTDEAPAAQERSATVGTEEPPSTPTPTWTVAAGDTIVASGTATATGDAANETADGMARTSAFSVNESAPANSSPSTGANAASTTLLTSTATPTVVTTPLPTPTTTPVVYQVRAGDTLVTIASQYDVEVEALMEANDIDAQEVFVLQPGQMLYIPTAVELPGAEPVVSTAGVSGAWRLEAPDLVMPTDDAAVGCATGGELIWQRVQFVKDSDKYVLHLGFVNGETNDGQEDVVWILAQSSPVTQTEWELDTSLCDLAPAQFGHQWRWWVEVVEEVDGRTVPVSPPSVIRGFVWE